MRLLYIPAFGATGSYRSPGPIPEDVTRVIQSEGEEEVKYNDIMKDKSIGVEGAEKSLLDKWEKLQKKKEALGCSPKKPAPVKMEAKPADVEQLPVHHSRKARREIAEHLEKEGEVLVISDGSPPGAS